MTISWALVIAAVASGVIAGVCEVGRLDMILVCLPWMTLAAWRDES